MDSTHDPRAHSVSAEADPQPKTEGGNDEKGFAAKFPLRILIADDDYISRRTIRFMLEGLGYSVDSVENGQECMKACAKHHYDLVLLDLDMPVLDGIECARHLRHAKNAASLVALTAVPVQIARLASMGAGLNGYLEKPFKMDELKQTLRVACFNRDLR